MAACGDKAQDSTSNASGDSEMSAEEAYSKKDLKHHKELCLSEVPKIKGEYERLMSERNYLEAAATIRFCTWVLKDEALTNLQKEAEKAEAAAIAEKEADRQREQLKVKIAQQVKVAPELAKQLKATKSSGKKIELIDELLEMPDELLSTVSLERGNLEESRISEAVKILNGSAPPRILDSDQNGLLLAKKYHLPDISIINKVDVDMVREQNKIPTNSRGQPRAPAKGDALTFDALRKIMASVDKLIAIQIVGEDRALEINQSFKLSNARSELLVATQDRARASSSWKRYNDEPDSSENRECTRRIMNSMSNAKTLGGNASQEEEWGRFAASECMKK